MVCGVILTNKNQKVNKYTLIIIKTVASRLNATGVPLDEIRKILGHSQTATTLGYIFNPFNTEETEKRIESALSIGF